MPRTQAPTDSRRGHTRRSAGDVAVPHRPNERTRQGDQVGWPQERKGASRRGFGVTMSAMGERMALLPVVGAQAPNFLKTSTRTGSELQNTGPFTGRPSSGSMPAVELKAGVLRSKRVPAGEWPDVFISPIQVMEGRQDARSAVASQKYLGKLASRRGYVYILTPQIHPPEPKPGAGSNSAPENWKSARDDLIRAVLVAAGAPESPEFASLMADLPRLNFDKDTETLPIDIERAYTQRIAELEEAAEEEGYAVMGESQRDFWTFVRTQPSWCQADVILTDEGCLCAIWYTEDDRQVEVEFLGAGQCRLIVFENPGPSTMVLPEISTSDLQTTCEQIAKFTFVSVGG